ncbi:hypothetical protein HanXRQr2_Chr05g0195991 [Helianthus annuus]|uniref:Uncharacterized protein n=1 Tax=Helianthus annuus TaxID=4232 RepID=A0A9K3IXA2_HELAN|nr:hypothetical protein HanXRQr2_Chr05g0195991 [Helianthus annuus]KAJ0921256.1 hypothetical protein HanPSC8_Chr05g0189391 [Helianthus annuus]
MAVIKHTDCYNGARIINFPRILLVPFWSKTVYYCPCSDPFRPVFSHTVRIGCRPSVFRLHWC